MNQLVGMPMKIFLAHAKEDESATLDIYNKLKGMRFSPWMDIKDIPGGVNWDHEIQKNFSNADVVIIIVSHTSNSKNGYIRKEINDTLDKLSYYQKDYVYAIPLLIDDSIVPDSISKKLQYIDYKKSEGFGKLMSSLLLAAKQRNIDLTEGIKYGELEVKINIHEEHTTNPPAHQIDISYPSFISNKYPISARTLTDYYSGRTAQIILSQRTSPWPFRWDWNDENPYSFTSTYKDTFQVTYSNTYSISIVHSVNWYGAGAAHPNSHYETQNFLINDNDELHRLTLDSFLLHEKYKDGIEKIKNKIIQELPALYWNKTQQKPSQEDINYFSEGVNKSNLSCFTFDNNGLYFYFPAYELNCYALGDWTAFVPYYDFIDNINPDGPLAKVKI